MKRFLESALKQNIIISEFTEMYDKLPLAYKGRYAIFRVESNGVSWIAIKPYENVGIVTLRKDRNKTEKESNMDCAVFLDSTTFYIKEKLMEEGIPFVVKNKLVYLPFIGYLIKNKSERSLSPVQTISFLTQKLLLTAIYEKWNKIGVTEASICLNISKMSASRCFDELEYLDIDVLKTRGKSRVITVPDDLKMFWNSIKDKLRTPVIKTFNLAEDIKLLKKAGISALSELSLLEDNSYPTYALVKSEINDSQIKTIRQAGKMEKIESKVLELGYFINYQNRNVQDPLSVALSITEYEKEDERVNISIEDMLEEYVWSKLI